MLDEKMIDSITFTIGPITAIIAAKFGIRAWLGYEIIVTTIVAMVNFFQPELFFGIFVSEFMFSKF